MKIEKDYEPFGFEWLTEMKKWNKERIISLLRTSLIEIHKEKNLKQAHVIKSVCSCVEAGGEEIGYIQKRHCNSCDKVVE